MRSCQAAWAWWRVRGWKSVPVGGGFSWDRGAEGPARPEFATQTEVKARLSWGMRVRWEGDGWLFRDPPCPGGTHVWV